ncbi:MAG: type IX secretion system membrane protein PorP/SprF [Marinilabiliaceae bacterium]|nr:type IX secretion system membrane protein PorP/SprF [Marinilabiliaceae bacterium]
MKKFLFLFIFIPLYNVIMAQKEIEVSQYMLNRYAINSAFGGSHDALSAFGSYKQKWVGIEKAPASQFLSVHAPLKNESIALGLQFFSQSYGVIRESGVTASYTFRVRTNEKSWLAFSLKGGLSFASPDWNSVPVKDPDDIAFASQETINTPEFGIGLGWYSKNYFLGFSVPNFYYNDIVDFEDAVFKPANSTYIFTGGYIFSITDHLQVMPSCLVALSNQLGSFYDVGGALIWNDKIWIGGNYRSTDDIVALLAYQFHQQWRFAYSYDYSIGDLKGYNDGSHEISLQFVFGYKIITPSPKYF